MQCLNLPDSDPSGRARFRLNSSAAIAVRNFVGCRRGVPFRVLCRLRPSRVGLAPGFPARDGRRRQGEQLPPMPALGIAVESPEARTGVPVRIGCTRAEDLQRKARPGGNAQRM
jgi:hypothetical protein